MTKRSGKRSAHDRKTLTPNFMHSKLHELSRQATNQELLLTGTEKIRIPIPDYPGHFLEITNLHQFAEFLSWIRKFKPEWTRRALIELRNIASSSDDLPIAIPSAKGRLGFFQLVTNAILMMETYEQQLKSVCWIAPDEFTSPDLDDDIQIVDPFGEGLL